MSEQVDLEDVALQVFQEHAESRGYEGVVTDHLSVYVITRVTGEGGTDTTLVLLKPDGQSGYVTKGLLVDALDTLRMADLLANVEDDADG